MHKREESNVHNRSADMSQGDGTFYFNGGSHTPIFRPIGNESLKEPSSSSQNRTPRVQLSFVNSPFGKAMQRDNSIIHNSKNSFRSGNSPNDSRSKASMVMQSNMQRLMATNIGMGTTQVKGEILSSLIGLHKEKIEELRLRDNSLMNNSIIDNRFFTSMKANQRPFGTDLDSVDGQNVMSNSAQNMD